MLLSIIEYANDKKLQQDHPCVIRLIRDKYLRQPADKNLPYQLDHPERIDSSDGQAKDVRNILKNKVSQIISIDAIFLDYYLYIIGLI